MSNDQPTQSLPGLLRKRPIWVALGAFVLLLALVLFLLPSDSGQAETAFFEVRRGDFTVSIVEGGNLEAVDEVVIRNEVEGSSRIIYIVPEGTYVKKGDLLVELDPSQAQDQWDQQKLAVEKAQFSLIQAENQYKIQESVAESDIARAELTVKFANMDLEKFLQAQQFTDLAAMSNTVVEAAEQLTFGLDKYEWSKKLAEKGYETARTAESDRLSVIRSQNSLLIESNRLLVLKKYDLVKSHDQLQSDLSEATKELDRVKAQTANKLAQAQADVMTQSNTLALNLKKLERYEDNLKGTTIKADEEGLVVYPISNSRHSSESMIEEGATVRNRQELIKLPDTSQMKVSIKVHESQVNLAQAGQPAFVVLDSMPDRRFRGTVSKVALLPDTGSRWGNPNLKVYKTEVLVTEALPDVKPGVSASVEIVVTNIQNAISAPIQAVTTLKGKQVAYVQKGKDPAPVPVEVGLFNTKFIEIVSGLDEGDRVLLTPPFDTEEQDLEGSLLAQGEKVDIPPSAPPAARRVPGAEQERGSATAGRAGAAGGQRQPGGPGVRQGGFDPAAMMKQFDTDGDGELSDSEREAARAEMRKRFGGAGGPGGGQDGQGAVRGGEGRARGGLGGQGGGGRPQ